MTTTEIAERIIPPAEQLPAVFGTPGAIDAILDRIAEAARAEAPDLSTATGRARIASIAHKVARSKTTLDDAGKKLGDDARKQIAAIDAERRKIRDRLDALKAEVRAPLTEWEASRETQNARIEAVWVGWERNVVMAEAGQMTSNDAKAALVALDTYNISTMQASDLSLNRVEEAAEIRDRLRPRLVAAIERIEKAEAEAAELARLRAEAEARERAEAERRAQEEAKAREAAEAERRRQAEERAAQAAREAAEREAAEKIAAAERAKQEAERRAAAAAQAERDRIEMERRKAEEAEARKLAHARTRAKVKREIVAALMATCKDDAEPLLDEVFADAAAEAILSGRIPHVVVRL